VSDILTHPGHGEDFRARPYDERRALLSHYKPVQKDKKKSGPGESVTSAPAKATGPSFTVTVWSGNRVGRRADVEGRG
jgi:hypothetical protein